MLIKTLVVGHIETNCYVVTDEKTLECAVIDPGAESNTIMNYIEENSLKCRAIFLTHVHFDHVMALPKLYEQTGARVYVCKKDLETVETPLNKGGKLPKDTVYYQDGDEITVSSLVFKVIATPGHTPGGVSLVCGDAIFSGDTLFAGSCGRTDFPGGDMKQIIASLKKLADLPGDYAVYPGHEGATRLSREREYNPYMRMALGMR
ncbi:MAG TPA: MBL fold metallo-hydrolase [Clostridiales bacterium]|nr:MBL fold metallo-hydrolase [Clostridiales bacterium]